VLGHEGAGIVEGVGENVTRVKPGDKVVLSWIAPCGNCYQCSRLRPHLCGEALKNSANGTMPDGTSRLYKNGQTINQFYGLSTFAEYAVVMESACVVVPKDVPLKSAALVGCAVMTGIGAVWNTANAEQGSSVVVFGAGGGVGLNSVQGARLVNALPIIAVDVNDLKLETAKKFGATHVINSTNDDVAARVKELTGGEGADYAFDAYGYPKTITQAYECVRRGGTVVVIGIAPVGVDVSISAMSLPFTEKKLTGSFYGSGNNRVDFLRIIDQYQHGNIKLDELVSRTYPLEQINEAFEDLGNGRLARGVLMINPE